MRGGARRRCTSADADLAPYVDFLPGGDVARGHGGARMSDVRRASLQRGCSLLAANTLCATKRRSCRRDPGCVGVFGPGRKASELHFVIEIKRLAAANDANERGGQWRALSLG